MGWHSRDFAVVLALALGSGCSAGVNEGAGTFGGVTVASTKGDHPADTGGDDEAGPEEASSAADADADGDGDASTAEPADTTSADTTGSAPVGECGDGVIQGEESCDGRELGGSCADYGFDDGVLVCDPECNHVTDACFTCGDGELGLGEACDGDELGGATCVSLGFGGGNLACSVDCQTVIDTGCVALPSCGDGALNGGEVCDGGNLGGNTCQSQGYDLGTITCTNSCTLDVSNCEDDLTNCGHEGDFCLFDENDLQSTCCPAGVGGNMFGLCNVFVCV